VGAAIKSLDVARLLKDYGLRPAKGLGQNFLVDTAALERIVKAAALSPDDEVLEIGPGLGSLTRHLALAARRVVAVELDAKLIPPLRAVLADAPNVEIVQGDILNLDPADHFKHSGYQVVANIPYYITSALIRHLLSVERTPARLVLTVQREVAQRIVAEPGDLSLLALSVQVYGAARIVCGIPARAFYPKPKVASAVVRVDVYDTPRIPPEQLDNFFRLAKAGFSQKRKTLANSLAAGLARPKGEIEGLLERIGIDPRRRAQTLSLEEWGGLTAEFMFDNE
jgi:16S rRNA (adenine1518-N6/adenine1519-N6)-dimethyltransferase